MASGEGIGMGHPQEGIALAVDAAPPPAPSRNDLSQEGNTGRWRATLPAGELSQAGTYWILYTASKGDALMPDLALQGLPVARTITVGSGKAADTTTPSATATVTPTAVVE